MRLRVAEDRRAAHPWCRRARAAAKAEAGAGRRPTISKGEGSSRRRSIHRHQAKLHPRTAAMEEALTDDLVEDILLRLPSDDPASLLSAALVCKRWCRIVSGPGFHRRFRGLHRTPPTLGFLHRKFIQGNVQYRVHETRFVPAATSSVRRLPHAVGLDWLALDALHGHILFSDIEVARGTKHLGIIVWNPMTSGEVRRLPILVPPNAARWTGRLLCVAAGEDHHADDCVLRVVVLSRCRSTGITSAIVYSPEQHAWSVQASTHHDNDRIAFSGVLRSARIGNADALYFFGNGGNESIVKYDVGKQQLSMISLPSEPRWKKKMMDTRFMTTENGGLGLAMVDGCNLYTLSFETGVDGGQAGWGNERVFSLSKLLPPNITGDLYVPTVVDVPGVIWIGTEMGLFSIDVKSSQVRKLWDGRVVPQNMLHIVPYMNFCTPAAVKADNVESEDDDGYYADNAESENADGRYCKTTRSTDSARSVAWSDAVVRYMCKLAKCCRGRVAFFSLFGIVLYGLASFS